MTDTQKALAVMGRIDALGLQNPPVGSTGYVEQCNALRRAYPAMAAIIHAALDCQWTEDPFKDGHWKPEMVAAIRALAQLEDGDE